ncbi:hypothetical protein J2853_003378 [Streptosporangium lutulentum]|uniref:Tn3 transposase DDE domain-containing protein n=1 Tax=Streptosporangium lutulentum TaxID=1461250 RepID=A0ABT9QBL7_9ACTN|nr:hypothetical protein [Streptosporangium lutulentum]
MVRWRQHVAGREIRGGYPGRDDGADLPAVAWENTNFTFIE